MPREDGDAVRYRGGSHCETGLDDRLRGAQPRPHLPPAAQLPLWDELGPPGSEAAGWTTTSGRTLDEALAHVTPTRAGGGQAANTTHALARLGYRAAMVGRVGKDEDGAFLLDGLKPAEAKLVAGAGETGRVYVLLDEDGERRNLVWPAANDQFAPADVPRLPPRTRFACFTSFAGDRPLEAQLTLLERLPAETEVCFDPGEIYARKGVKRFLPLIHRCSYLFATEGEPEMPCGLRRRRPSTFCSTPASASWSARWAAAAPASSAGAPTCTCRHSRPKWST